MAVSMGDAAGIGPEVVLKALTSSGISNLCLPLIIGDHRVFREILPPLGLDLPVHVYRDVSQVRWGRKGLHILQIGDAPETLPVPGRIDTGWARAAMAAVAAGVKMVQREERAALVTAPINKEGIHRAGYTFQGHTDYLASLTGTRDYAMMLVGGDIRVVLVTVHIPLRDVSRSLKKDEIIRKIFLAHEAMIRFRVPEPKIAVAGLNPHGGEGGGFGDEEARVIAPAVAAARGAGLAVAGPLPPDTLFYKMARGEYDVAVVMYHDQGLIPLKMAAFDRGVNITLGLPFIRTSPDHGTAYDIAGRGIADPSSMIEAVKTACFLTSTRLNPTTES